MLPENPRTRWLAVANAIVNVTVITIDHDVAGTKAIVSVIITANVIDVDTGTTIAFFIHSAADSTTANPRVTFSARSYSFVTTTG